MTTSLVGESVGLADGDTVGEALGLVVGAAVGDCVASDGLADGDALGDTEGETDGAGTDGLALGDIDGLSLGLTDGDVVGSGVGAPAHFFGLPSQCPLVQSELSPHVLPLLHLGQLSPPQSSSVSSLAESCWPFAHWSTPHWPVDVPPHLCPEVAQSAPAARQLFPSTHLGDAQSAQVLLSQTLAAPQSDGLLQLGDGPGPGPGPGSGP